MRLTQQQLDEGLAHLQYELQMLAATATEPTPDQLQMNMVVESFAIHLRVLVTFLCTPPQKADIAASDYLPDWDYTQAFAALSETLKRAWTRASKEVAHLTTERKMFQDESTNWNRSALAAEVQRHVALFKDALAKSGTPNDPWIPFPRVDATYTGTWWNPSQPPPPRGAR